HLEQGVAVLRSGSSSSRISQLPEPGFANTPRLVCLVVISSVLRRWYTASQSDGPVPTRWGWNVVSTAASTAEAGASIPVKTIISLLPHEMNRTRRERPPTLSLSEGEWESTRRVRRAEPRKRTRRAEQIQLPRVPNHHPLKKAMP